MSCAWCATPGHTADSVCLLLPADGALLTGDTVLGRGTTVIAGDGSLADYLATLDRLRALADEQRLSTLLPGHGPVLADPAGVLDFYIAHRQERLAEIRAALAAGDRTGEEIVARVYADVDRSLLALRPVVGAGPARLPGRARANCPRGSAPDLSGRAWPAAPRR